MPDEAPKRLEIHGLTMRFGANLVLRGVDLAIGAGEVVALMGANGAGKSTLVKIVAGVHRQTGGSLRLDGAPFLPASPSDAQRAGVAIVHQLINDGVVLSMTVAENLVIDRLCAGEGGLLATPGRTRGAAAEIARRAGLDLPLSARVRDLSLADRQQVAIARALTHDPKLLILDEPTSAISEAEAERLFLTVERLKAQGVAILYISHRMGDIRRLADRIVTLRDGRITGTFARPIDYAGAVGAMLGRAIEERDHAPAARGRAVVELRGYRAEPRSPALDLTLHAGETTAVVGLIGAGKTELAECLYGLRRPVAGAARIDGAPHAPASPEAAIRAGVFMAAEDRGSDGLVPTLPVFANISLPFLRAFSAAGFLRAGAERENARAQIARLGVKCESEADPVQALSGGNQQKVILARWLTRPCRLLILDEPFQGVDIAARREIARKVRETAAERATLLLLSDLEEALEAADRVLVMHQCALVADHAASDLDQNRVVREMAGRMADAPEPAHAG